MKWIDLKRTNAWVIIILAVVVFGVQYAVSAIQAEPIIDNPDEHTDIADDHDCPFGIVHDPYPGRCRLYQDADDDGYCDLSM